MNELIEALRKAVRAEIEAALHAAGPISDNRHVASLAERMEVERCWAHAARMAGQMGREGVRAERYERAMSGPFGPP